MICKPKELFVWVDFRNQKTKAHVLIYGNDSKKPQVLCLHGLGSTARESFIEIAPLLASEFQVVAVDWIGCGESSRLMGPGDSYSSDYCSEWLKDFILSANKNGVLYDEFNVFAVSMSAISIPKNWEVIRKFVKKIVFVNPLGMDTRINRILAIALTHPWINQNKLANLLLSNFMWTYFFKWTKRDQKRLKEGVKNGEFEVLVRYAKAGILPSGRLMDINIVPGKFKKIKAPILLLASVHDHVFYRRDYLKFAKTQENWEVVEVDHNDHNCLVAKAKEVAAETLRFLKDTT